MSKATKDTMELLHEAVAQALMEKIQSGEANASDISAAIKFLKDNHIEVSVDDPKEVLKNLQLNLPDDYDSDEEAA